MNVTRTTTQFFSVAVLAVHNTPAALLPPSSANPNAPRLFAFCLGADRLPEDPEELSLTLQNAAFAQVAPSLPAGYIVSLVAVNPLPPDMLTRAAAQIHADSPLNTFAGRTGTAYFNDISGELMLNTFKPGLDAANRSPRYALRCPYCASSRLRFTGDADARAFGYRAMVHYGEGTVATWKEPPPKPVTADDVPEWEQGKTYPPGAFVRDGGKFWVRSASKTVSVMGTMIGPAADQKSRAWHSLLEREVLDELNSGSPTDEPGKTPVWYAGTDPDLDGGAWQGHSGAAFELTCERGHRTTLRFVEDGTEQGTTAFLVFEYQEPLTVWSNPTAPGTGKWPYRVGDTDDIPAPRRK